MKKQAESFLPLTHTTYLILIALIHPAHGYGIMQKIESLSDGEVVMGPGTLYGALSKLLKQGLILKVDEDDRRKIYGLTDLGREVIRQEYDRLKMLVDRSRDVVREMGGSDEKD